MTSMNSLKTLMLAGASGAIDWRRRRDGGGQRGRGGKLGVATTAPGWPGAGKSGFNRDHEPERHGAIWLVRL